MKMSMPHAYKSTPFPRRWQRCVTTCPCMQWWLTEGQHSGDPRKPKLHGDGLAKWVPTTLNRTSSVRRTALFLPTMMKTCVARPTSRMSTVSMCRRPASSSTWTTAVLPPRPRSFIKRMWQVSDPTMPCRICMTSYSPLMPEHGSTSRALNRRAPTLNLLRLPIPWDSISMCRHFPTRLHLPRVKSWRETRRASAYTASPASGMPTIPTTASPIILNTSPIPRIQATVPVSTSSSRSHGWIPRTLNIVFIRSLTVLDGT